MGISGGLTLRLPLGRLRLNRDRLAEQTAQESRVEKTIKSENSGEIAKAKNVLASLLMKKDQALVVRVRLKRMSSDIPMNCELKKFEVSQIDISLASHCRMGVP